MTAQAIADAFVELGYAIGFTGIITYPKNDALRQVAAALPAERILIETDAPFLTPQRYRGQSNEPAYVTEVATEIARVRGVSVEAVDRATTATAQQLFRI
jgi:TatD DNase family protein